MEAVREVMKSQKRLVALSGLISFPWIAQIRVYTITSTTSSTLHPKEILLRFNEDHKCWSIDNVRRIDEWKHFPTMPTEEDSTSFYEYLRHIVSWNKYNDVSVTNKDFERFLFTQFHPTEFGMHSFDDDIFSRRMKVLMRALPARHIAAFCSIFFRRLFPIIWYSRIEIDFDFGSEDGIHSFWTEIICKKSLEEDGKTDRAIVHYKRFVVPPPSCLREALSSFSRDPRRYSNCPNDTCTSRFKIISMERSAFLMKDSVPL